LRWRDLGESESDTWGIQESRRDKNNEGVRQTDPIRCDDLQEQREEEQ
jgi:hypothetical protein